MLYSARIYDRGTTSPGGCRMRTEDLILVSVDDHVVEPPSLAEYLEDHVPAKFKARVPRVIRRDERDRRLADRGPGDRQLRPQRGAGPPPRELGRRSRELRPGAAGHVRRARAHPRHERQRRPRLAELPVVARPRRPVLRAERRHRVRRGDDPGLQRLAHRRVVRRVPRSLHPPRAVGLRARRRVDGRRDPPRRREGLPRGVLPLGAAPLRHRRHPRPGVGPARGRRATTSARSRSSTSAASRASCPGRRSR